MPENKKEVLIIENKKPAAFILPPFSASELIEERKGMLLLPGENNVSFECWEYAKRIEGVRIALRSNHLENKGPGKATSLLQDWSRVTVEQGTRLIEALTDIEAINKIKAQVKQKGLKFVCDARIETIIAENEEANA